MTASRLRHLIHQGGLVVAPGVYDGVSAALVEHSGFAAAYMSGAAVSASAVGLPDIGLTTMTEMVSQVAVINRRLTIPLIADADTGFGDITNVYRTVQEYELAGAAGIQLEDQVFPKRCGHLDEKEVIDEREFVDKINAAVDARDDMLIIARTDARAVHGLDDALRRAASYAAAGADVIFVEAPQSVAEIERIPKEVDAPVLFNLVPRGKTPLVTLDQLEEFGYSIVIAPGAGIGGAVRGINDALAALARRDLTERSSASPRELFNTVGLPFWENVRSSFDSGGRHA